jgi:hypothetical protein
VRKGVAREWTVGRWAGARQFQRRNALQANIFRIGLPVASRERPLPPSTTAAQERRDTGASLSVSGLSRETVDEGVKRGTPKRAKSGNERDVVNRRELGRFPFTPPADPGALILLT